MTRSSHWTVKAELHSSYIAGIKSKFNVSDKYANSWSKTSYFTAHVNPRTNHGSPGEVWKYVSTLSLTSAQDGVGGQFHILAALTLKDTLYPLYRRLGGPRALHGACENFSPHPEIRFPDGPARSASLYLPGHAFTIPTESTFRSYVSINIGNTKFSWKLNTHAALKAE